MSKERFVVVGAHTIKDTLNNDYLEIEDGCEVLNQQGQRIKELEEQLKNARKETAKKVIGRVEELSVFDFKACEEHDLRKYTITELALDAILREFQG